MGNLTFIWALLFLGSQTAHAVPPLVASDVPTAPKGVVEVFLGTRYQKTEKIERQIPFSEIVLGISNWQEITFEIPYLSVSPSQVSQQRGIGDAIVGTKMMFLREDEQGPGAALSFEMKLENGNQSKGLGSGALEYDLRLRIQKTWGWFTGLWNVGNTIVGEPIVSGIRQDRRDVWFAAFAQEYHVTSEVALLSEIYWKNSDVPGEPNRFAGDIGIKHNVSPWLQLQVAVGKSLRDSNLGGPSLRVYGGVKLEFLAISVARSN